jgi:hypothetical protein
MYFNGFFAFFAGRLMRSLRLDGSQRRKVHKANVLGRYEQADK